MHVLIIFCKLGYYIRSPIVVPVAKLIPWVLDRVLLGKIYKLQCGCGKFIHESLNLYCNTSNFRLYYKIYVNTFAW